MQKINCAITYPRTRPGQKKEENPKKEIRIDYSLILANRGNIFYCLFREDRLAVVYSVAGSGEINHFTMKHQFVKYCNGPPRH
jgi:hypothetical protein